VKSVNCAGEDHFSIGALVHDIKALVTSLVSFKCYQVSRLCNRATHVFAKSVEHGVGDVWVNVVREIIRTIVCI
jgi:hypothetical protein